jgi:hypothetical protein
MLWDESMAMTRVDDRRFAAKVDDRWSSLQGVHGGVVAALAVTASTPSDSSSHPRPT